MNRQILLLLAIVCFSFAIDCTTNADCNNHGVCLSTYNGKGCSCLSGFGTSTCSTRPAAACTYSPVFTNVTNFAPSVTASVNSAQISFGVTANLEQTQYAAPGVDDTLGTANTYALETQVKFGGSSTPCDYPPSQSGYSWTHPAADANCKDTWGLTIPWAQAISNCGFSNSGSDHTWTQTVNVARKYQLPDLGDGASITRTESISKVVNIVFPTSVNVQTDVNVTGPVAVSVNAIVSSSYNPGTNTWSIAVKTLTNRPYKLSSPTASFTGIGARSTGATIVANTACNSNDSPCTQTITLTFSGCSALVGGVVIQTTPVCSGTASNGIGSTCPIISGYVNIGLAINNADSCAIINNIDFSVKSLYSFSDSALTLPNTLFAASDIAYFGAVIQSTNATLTGFSLTGACLSWNGGNCQAVTTSPITPNGGMSPTFAINLAQTRYLTTDTSRQTFTVKATVAVTWANGKRDVQEARANIDAEVSVNLAELDGTSDTAASGSFVLQASVAFAIVMIMLSFL